MTSAIQQAIEEIEHDIEGLQQGIVDRQKAIAVLRGIAGEPDEDVLRRGPAKRAASTSQRTAAFQPANAEDLDAAIVRCLRDVGSPVKPKDLAPKVGLAAFQLRVRLKALAKQKRVVVTGTTAGRRVSLPSTPARGHL